MRDIQKFVLKDVRCFRGEKEFNIRPLTFLVGENSTGKSTILGCFQALSSFMSFRQLGGIDFNSQPYQMGAYANIARRTNKIADIFKLGFDFSNLKYTLSLVQRKDSPEPVVKSVEMIFEDGALTINLETPEKNRDSAIPSDKDGYYIEELEQNKFMVYLNENKNTINPYLQFDWRYLATHLQSQSLGSYGNNARINLMNYLRKKESDGSLFTYYNLINTPDSFAPIRSKPARTYDALREETSPEGSEMPIVLMNMSTSNVKMWESLKIQLEEFGKASGLFSYVGVRKFGRSASGPFQLQIKARGPKANLMDVGYGVSQILPILVRILTRSRTTFLLQQPEVHLHPIGQAEFTSLLVTMGKEEKNSFIIETHSDHIINRARIEIMKGRLNPKDVSLIYLEPSGNEVQVYNIEFDSDANMIGEIGNYHDFFLREQNRLLGFGE